MCREKITQTIRHHVGQNPLDLDWIFYFASKVHLCHVGTVKCWWVGWGKEVCCLTSWLWAILMLKEILILELPNAIWEWTWRGGLNFFDNLNILSWKIYKLFGIQHILKFIEFWHGGRKPVTRNNCTNYFAYMEANQLLNSWLFNLIYIISSLWTSVS